MALSVMFWANDTCYLLVVSKTENRDQIPGDPCILLLLRNVAFGKTSIYFGATFIKLNKSKLSQPIELKK